MRRKKRRKYRIKRRWERRRSQRRQWNGAGGGESCSWDEEGVGRSSSTVITWHEGKKRKCSINGKVVL